MVLSIREWFLFVISLWQHYPPAFAKKSALLESDGIPRADASDRPACPALLCPRARKCDPQLPSQSTWLDLDLAGLGLGWTCTWLDLDLVGLGLGWTWTWLDLYFVGLGLGWTWTWLDLDLVGLGLCWTWTWTWWDLYLVGLGLGWMSDKQYLCKKMCFTGLNQFILMCWSSPW